MTASTPAPTLTAEEELAKIRELVDETIDRDLVEHALADRGDENASTLDRLRTVLHALRDAVDTLADVPWCTCGGDYRADCPVDGPVGLLEALDRVAASTTGMEVHEKAIADQLHADGVAVGISRVALAQAAARWGYACPRCNGYGIVDGGGAAASCPECDGNPDYYEMRKGAA